MSTKEFLTVKQFAEKAKVSTQSIYKRLNNHTTDELHKFIKVESNKKLININALKLYLDEEKMQLLQSKYVRVAQLDNPNNNQLQSQLEFLKQELNFKNEQINKLSNQFETQLENKDNQLKEKDVQLKNLNERLAESQELNRNQQVLLKNEQQRLLLIQSEKKTSENQKKEKDKELQEVMKILKEINKRSDDLQSEVIKSRLEAIEAKKTIWQRIKRKKTYKHY